MMAAVSRPVAFLSSAVCLLVVACSSSTATPSAAEVTPSASETPAAEPSPTVSPEADEEEAILIAAGDIASCDRDTDQLTAALVAELDETGTVATLGDQVYPSGTDETFTNCYHPAWGGFLDRTRPAVGNHDLEADGGAAYFRYFGDRAGVPGEGWYSFDLGDWHVVALNSNCELVACGPGSPQHDWLVADLATHPSGCTLAYAHHPRFSSGPHGDYPPMAPLWDALHQPGADLILAGHDHLYERFAPQLPSGEPDAFGIRQITAGTGGYDLYQAVRVAPNSEVLIDDAHGVLELTLNATGYDWRFLTIDGAEADAGSGTCH
jgi:alkaline phosphatase